MHELNVFFIPFFFLFRFNKQVEKWETILAEKRVKMSKFDNYGIRT